MNAYAYSEFSSIKLGTVLSSTYSISAKVASGIAYDSSVTIGGICYYGVYKTEANQIRTTTEYVHIKHHSPSKVHVDMSEIQRFRFAVHPDQESHGTNNHTTALLAVLHGVALRTTPAQPAKHKLLPKHR